MLRPFLVFCVQRKWYRNILMKGFHLCVRLVAGGGIRDTQVPLLDSSPLLVVLGLILVILSASTSLFSNCTYYSNGAG